MHIKEVIATKTEDEDPKASIKASTEISQDATAKTEIKTDINEGATAGAKANAPQQSVYHVKWVKFKGKPVTYTIICKW